MCLCGIHKLGVCKKPRRNGEKMAEIIKFQEYVEARNKGKLGREKRAALPEESRKREETARETAEAGRRKPYIIVIY